MRTMITILDYGLGNITSVEKAFLSLGCDVLVTSDYNDIQKADVLVVPGQGAFSQAMARLKETRLDTLIIDHVKKGRPFLGICLGFQILFETSVENGVHQGLGLFPGTVEAFPKGTLKVPHMGWNTVSFQQKAPIWKGLDQSSYVYFVHSYCVYNTDLSIVASQTEYGLNFVSSISAKNVLATQVHPVKSGRVGIVLLTFFLNMMG